MSEGKKDKKLDLDKAKEYFDSLNIQEWKFCGNLNDKGGQATVVEVKNKKTGQIGVFRFLKKNTIEEKKDEEVKRFNRELKILTEISHPNIVEILDYTKDENHQWYISKKGDSFKAYWDKFVSKNKDNPDLIVEEAVRIVKKLSEGLSILHEKGVVHRDIKSSNIVMAGNNPVLIDFGISFVLGEERISDGPVCCFTGIDPASVLKDEVIPWLDVFLLSQLLMSMTCELNDKQRRITGHRDWRFVSYGNISEKNKKKLIAISAKCYNIIGSPKDASGFNELLSNLFDVTDKLSTDKKHTEDIDNIIESNNLDKLINEDEKKNNVNATLPLFSVMVKDFFDGMKRLHNELCLEFDVKLTDSLNLDEELSKMADNKQKQYNSTPCYLSLKRGGVEVYCRWNLSIWKYDFTRDGKFIDLPHIVFAIDSPGYKISSYLGNLGIDVNNHITPLSNGAIGLYNGNLDLKEELSVPTIIDRIRSNLIDVDTWNIASK